MVYTKASPAYWQVRRGLRKHSRRMVCSVWGFWIHLNLKRHHRAMIIKKSVLLSCLRDMSILCQHVHRLELHTFFEKLCVAHLPVEREIRTAFIFGHACLK